MLEKGEDFIAHDGGPIELTSTGLKRLVAGHVAGHEVVVEIDKCEVLVVRGPKAFAPPLPPQCAEQLAIAARLRADLRTAGSRARFARWRTQAHRDARWAFLDVGRWRGSPMATRNARSAADDAGAQIPPPKQSRTQYPADTLSR